MALMRLVMKPGDSLMTTTSLPMRLPTSTAVASVSSSVSSARTTSSSFIHRSGVFETLNCGCGIPPANLAQRHCFVEVGPDFALCLAQSSGQNIFQNRAISAERGRVRNATAHDPRADYADRLHRRHLL